MASITKKGVESHKDNACPHVDVFDGNLNGCVHWKRVQSNVILVENSSLVRSTFCNDTNTRLKIRPDTLRGGVEALALKCFARWARDQIPAPAAVFRWWVSWVHDGGCDDGALSAL